MRFPWVFQEVQPHMALRDRPQLWFLRDTRDQAFHLLLLGTGATVQRKWCFRAEGKPGNFAASFFADSEVKCQFLGWFEVFLPCILGFLHFCYLHFWYQETYLSFGFPAIETKSSEGVLKPTVLATGRLIVSTWRHLLNYTVMKVDGYPPGN